MIFAALCEYALILFIIFRRTTIIGKKKDKMRKNMIVGVAEDRKLNIDDAIMSERKIDKISLILFPTAFLVFVLIYSVKYLVK